jgi:hypothetical protein
MAKTLKEGFDVFIDSLKPLATEHYKAASHKDSVKRCLENNYSCSKMFETGSFGAGTGIRHYSDTDYFAVVPGANLHENSAYSLRKIKESLQSTFTKTDGIAVDTPAVKIPFGNYASETMEITPCCYNGMVETDLGKFNKYEIADGDNGWKEASPSAHNAYVNEHDKRLKGKLKPLIQLVKAWKYYNNAPISSFYLELRVSKYSEGESFIDYDIDLFRIFKFLNDNNLPAINDPMGITGRIVPCSTETKKETALNKIEADFKRAEEAYNNRESDLNKCFERWHIFFNNQFPKR